MAITDEREAAPRQLVVIDHHEAQVYRTEVHGAVPVRITNDPHGHSLHLHSAQEWTDGKRLPDRNGTQSVSNGRMFHGP